MPEPFFTPLIINCLGVIIAIWAGLLPLGKFIDWSFRKQKKDEIILKMANWENKLKCIPMKYWQVKVAEEFLKFWEIASKLPRKIFLLFGLDLKAVSYSRWLKSKRKAKRFEENLRKKNLYYYFYASMSLALAALWSLIFLVFFLLGYQLFVPRFFKYFKFILLNDFPVSEITNLGIAIFGLLVFVYFSILCLSLILLPYRPRPGLLMIHVLSLFRFPIKLIIFFGVLFLFFAHVLSKFLPTFSWASEALFLPIFIFVLIALYEFTRSLFFPNSIKDNIVFPLLGLGTLFEKYNPYLRGKREIFKNKLIELWKGEIFRVKKANVFFSNVFMDFIPLSFISVPLSSIAIWVGIQLSQNNSPTYWFEYFEEKLVPANSSGLFFANFPFDAITILISVKLLKTFLEKGKGLSLIALVDFFISGLLAFGLYLVLKLSQANYFELNALFGLFNDKETTKDFITVLSLSWDWWINLVTFHLPSNDPDLPIAPLLFTTFLPVGFYMSVIFFLGVMTYLIRISAYTCGLLGEKEKTPFYELAVAISWALTFLSVFYSIGKMTLM